MPSSHIFAGGRHDEYLEKEIEPGEVDETADVQCDRSGVEGQHIPCAAPQRATASISARDTCSSSINSMSENLTLLVFHRSFAFRLTMPAMRPMGNIVTVSYKGLDVGKFQSGIGGTSEQSADVTLHIRHVLRHILIDQAWQLDEIIHVAPAHDLSYLYLHLYLLLFVFCAEADGNGIEGNLQIVNTWNLAQVVDDDQFFVTILDLFFKRCLVFHLREFDGMFLLLLIHDGIA